MPPPPAGSDAAPVVVVGNKVDLDRERVVSFQRAQTWVDTDMTNASYLETSAKYNINVGELFKQLLIRTYGLANNEMVGNNDLLGDHGWLCADTIGSLNSYGDNIIDDNDTVVIIIMILIIFINHKAGYIVIFL